MTEYRNCRFCEERVPTAELVHYSVRSYAHADCLFKAKGEGALARLYSHQLKQVPVIRLSRAGFATPTTVLARLDELIRIAELREEDSCQCWVCTEAGTQCARRHNTRKHELISGEGASAGPIRIEAVLCTAHHQRAASSAVALVSGGKYWRCL